MLRPALLAPRRRQAGRARRGAAGGDRRGRAHRGRRQRERLRHWSGVVRRPAARPRGGTAHGRADLRDRALRGRAGRPRAGGRGHERRLPSRARRPLLREVRVTGDAVLSASRVRRLARLRQGEPLWPQRLERAGRDVGLALVDRGHLEALVEPEAVRVPGRRRRASSAIRAGPRVRVGRAAVQGAEALWRAAAGACCGRGRARCTARRAPTPRREAMRRALVRRRALARHGAAAGDVRSRAARAMRLVFRGGRRARAGVEVRGAELPPSLLADGARPGAGRRRQRRRAGGRRRADRERTCAAWATAMPPCGRVERASGAGEAVVFQVTPGARALAGSVQAARGRAPRCSRACERGRAGRSRTRRWSKTHG